MNDELGIIAGKGAYPLELAVSARQQGVRRLFAVAFKGETSRTIEDLVDEVRWMYVGQLSAFLAAFRESGISQAVMAGQITPSNLFTLRPDKAMLQLLKGLKRKNADTIFSAIGDELKRIGVELKPASAFMEACMPGPGVLTDRPPNESEREDMRLGFEVAKTTSRLKIGQTVVLKEGTIIAVEAFEGTDATIRRAGKQAGKGTVVVKVAQPDHDMRFDIPVVGLRTLRTMRRSGTSALALEAGRAILLERDPVLREANRNGIAIEVFTTADNQETDDT